MNSIHKESKVLEPGELLGKTCTVQSCHVQEHWMAIMRKDTEFCFIVAPTF